MAKRRTEDEDVHIADESDEAMRSVARYALTALRLPAERLPIMEREANSLRLIARERVDWCRYINLIQDLRHTLSADTCYRMDPQRSCVCEKHGYRSNIENPDPCTVINAFKWAYCNDCPDRQPKGRREGR